MSIIARTQRQFPYFDKLVELNWSRTINIWRKEYSLEGARRKLDTTDYTTAHLWIPYLDKGFLQFLEVNRPALVRIEEIKRGLKITRKWKDEQFILSISILHLAVP